MTVIPIYRPYVFLRCRKCGRKTDHVLINTATVSEGAMEETYECQQCGQTKKIYELDTTIEPQAMYSTDEPTPEVEEKLAIHGLEEKVKAKREALERLESKKKDLEERLKATTTVDPTSSQQPNQSEDQLKSKQKKKRKWL